MKIPLITRRFFPGEERLFSFAPVSIHLPKFGIRFKRIEALIDTGSPWSVIGQRDTERLQIPFRKLGPPRMIHIGGIPIHGYPLKNVELRILNEDQKIVSIRPPLVYILHAVERSKRSMARSRWIPSILGVDFLMDNGFALYFNPNERRSYLEK